MLSAPAADAACSPAAPDSGVVVVVTCDFTGAEQTFTVPATSALLIVATGAVATASPDRQATTACSAAQARMTCAAAAATTAPAAAATTTATIASTAVRATTSSTRCVSAGRKRVSLEDPLRYAHSVRLSVRLRTETL